MKSSRSLLLVTSTVLMVLVLGAGLADRAGEEENSYRQAVLFAEILSLVMDNYVDDVEARRLLDGAYEGLLAGLDSNGAYLTPEEVAEWKRAPEGKTVGPGISVLKGGSSLQVVAVDPGSPAEREGVAVGDQVREVDGRPVKDLSLAQCRRLLAGAVGSTVRLDLLRREDDFARYTVEIERTARRGRAYDLEVKEDVAVLAIHRLDTLDVEALTAELDDVHTRGVARLLIDLRNTSGDAPPAALPVASLFLDHAQLVLRDRAGEVKRSADTRANTTRWKGDVSVLVNGASAGGAEALALLLQGNADARIFGEPTFGMGAESDLLELEDGSALLVSVALWETGDGTAWNADGIKPDREVRGNGTDYASVRQDQLEKVLAILDKDDDAERVEAA